MISARRWEAVLVEMNRCAASSGSAENEDGTTLGKQSATNRRQATSLVASRMGLTRRGLARFHFRIAVLSWEISVDFSVGVRMATRRGGRKLGA
jgi:hypothetical protein